MLPAPIIKLTSEIQSMRRLGLTATLVREDGLEKDVFCLIGPKKFDMPWRELEEKKFIAEAYCYDIRIPLDESHRDDYIISSDRGKFRIASENVLKYDIVKKIIEKVEGKNILIIGQYISQLEEMQKNAGSEDYRNAKGIMKPTFVKVVNDDVSDILKDVKCSTLLVWGEFDTAAPLWMGKQMEKEMPDAGLAIFENDDHWAYWHQPDRFNAVLDIFFKGDEA